MPRQKKGGLGKRIIFRLDDEDWKYIQTNVVSSNLTLSDFIRSAVLSHRSPPEDRDNKVYRKKILFLAAKISNNVNQLARRANADHLTGKISEKTYQEILYNLDRLTWLFKSVVRDKKC